MKGKGGAMDWITRAVALACAGAAVSAVAAEFDCVIEPRQVVELRSPIEGLIARVNVDRGDFVKQGQELVVLDSAVEQVQAAMAKHRSQMQGALDAGKSRVQFSLNKSRRAEELHRENFISAQGRDEALTERALAEAELREAADNRKLAEFEYLRQREVIRLKTIRSPINGVVTERILNVGELAESGVGRKPLMKLAEIDVLHVEVLLPIEAHGKVRRGMIAEVVPRVPAGVRHRATVKVIDTVFDAGSGTFGVRLELPNRDRRIPAGVRCKAVFPGMGASAAASAASPGASPGRETVRNVGAMR
jgi:RND family efflux transporter MFP subunit